MEQASSGLTALIALLSIPVLTSLSLRPAGIADARNPATCSKEMDTTAA